MGIYIENTMTGGGLMQLVAYGAQDVYLTGNPQVTFFKQLYKRHTNFSMQSVEATFNGTVGFGKRVSVIVPRVGDLMVKVYLYAKLPALVHSDGQTPIKWTPEVGHFLIKSVEVQIGGQTIDKHYSTWLSVWSALTLDYGKQDGYDVMIGGKVTGQEKVMQPETEIYVPLQFWFCQHEGLALPLIALQYHEVRFIFEFEQKNNLIHNNLLPDGAPLDQAQLYIDYIFLDTDERRKFAQQAHKYLITQVQFTGDVTLTGTTTQCKLNFNHPVKELIWVTLSDTRQNSEYETADQENPVDKAKLMFNGHDRFSERSGKYFNEVQPYQHHTNIPKSHGINVYSFSLYPEVEQPSGTSNFSRIDSAVLSISQNSIVSQENGRYAKIYALSMNIMRIMSGMGGLAYSN